MKVLLFGVSGNVGRAVARELLARGHQVTGATRSGTPVDGLDVPVIKASATDPEVVATSARGHDAVVSTVGPRPGVDNDEEVLVGAAGGLVAGLRGAGVRRLLVLGGAGSLEAAAGVLVLETPDFPDAWKPNALAQAAALELYRGASDLEWTYLSPAAIIEDGERTGKYRVGGDQLLTDGEGNSRISYPDFAIALVDQLEQGGAIRRRITVAY